LPGPELRRRALVATVSRTRVRPDGSDQDDGLKSRRAGCLPAFSGSSAFS
jgi:hypothetical protein